MKFQVNKDYYKSINELSRDHKRYDLWEDLYSQIKEIKQDLFDDYDVENIYIFGEILEKDQYYTDNISLLIEMNKDKFDRFADNKIITTMPKNISCYFVVGEEYYQYKNNRWVEGSDPPIYKLLL